jgi:predicted DNA-binding protein with PD1-like motif
MQARQVHEVDGLKTFVLVFERGDEVMRELKRFASERKLTASSLNAIGAFERATLGYFNWERKDYDRIEVDEQVEVVTLTGDIALDDGEPKIHAHVVLGRRDGSALGGHLLEATVRPTLELTLVETPATLQRRHDPESGLNLIRLEQT